jgi:predicted oxidoreductase
VRIALAWLRARPTVVSPIVGVRNVAQLDELIAGLDLELPSAALARLDDVSRPEVGYPWSFNVPEQIDRMSHGGARTAKWSRW